MTDHVSIDNEPDLDGGWAHRADLVAYATRLLGNRSAQAEDVVQEAYLRLLRAAAADKAPPDARRWLFTVVRNVAVDERRRSIREASFVSEAVARPAPSTADVVDQREEAAFALQHVAELPARERRAVELDQAGVGAPAIARSLGTTPNAVHQALFRARRSLRQARAAAWGVIPFPVVQLLLRTSGPTMDAAISGGAGAGAGRMLPAMAAAGALIAGSVGTGVYVQSHDAAAPAVHAATAKPAQATNHQVEAARQPVRAVRRASSTPRPTTATHPTIGVSRPSAIARPIPRVRTVTPAPEAVAPAARRETPEVEVEHSGRTTPRAESHPKAETPTPAETKHSGRSGSGTGSNRDEVAPTQPESDSGKGGGAGSGSGGSGSETSDSSDSSGHGSDGK